MSPEEPLAGEVFASHGLFKKATGNPLDTT